MTETTEITTTEEQGKDLVPRDRLLAPFREAMPEVLAALEACKGLTISGHVDGEEAGYRAVKAGRLALKGLRTPLERARKAAKAPFLTLGRLIDDEHERVEALIRPEESRLKSEEDQYLARKAEEKRIRERRGARRLAEAVEAGAMPGEVRMEIANGDDDEAWQKELERVGAIGARRRLGQARYQEILDAGIPQSVARINPPSSLEGLEEAMFRGLLTGLVNDQKERIEADRKARETERRALVLRAEGATVPDDVGELSPEEFDGLLEIARGERVAREEQAKREREELLELRRKAAPKAAPQASTPVATTSCEAVVEWAWSLEQAANVGATIAPPSPEIGVLMSDLIASIRSHLCGLREEIDRENGVPNIDEF